MYDLADFSRMVSRSREIFIETFIETFTEFFIVRKLHEILHYYLSLLVGISESSNFT